MILCLQAVADAMYGVQQGCRKRLVDRLAQEMNVTAQAVTTGQVLTPQKLLQGVSLDHMGTSLHQFFQQLEADRAELEGFPLAGDFQAVHIIDQVPDLEAILHGRLAAAQHRFHPGMQFRQGKWFDQVIVGPGLESGQLVVNTVSGRKHNNRRENLCVLAQSAAEGDAIHAR
jgi:hypothetical protein